jgi:hypothetical protein
MLGAYLLVVDKFISRSTRKTRSLRGSDKSYWPPYVNYLFGFIQTLLKGYSLKRWPILYVYTEIRMT